jgi:transcriptional regulator GlxA family with amidase domain
MHHRNSAGPDVLVVPGAEDVSGVGDAAVSWIRGQAEKTRFITAVCTGALILQRAGLLAGRKANHPLDVR